jgi:membrane protein implicated in regulation of membrane protease activity
MEFGFLCVYAAFMIPVYVFIFLILLVLPLIYIGFATQSTLPLALYLFAVLGCVAVYCIHKFSHEGDPDVPRQGRPMETEERAQRRSRSLISKSSNSDRRR